MLFAAILILCVVCVSGLRLQPFVRPLLKKSISSTSLFSNEFARDETPKPAEPVAKPEAMDLDLEDMFEVFEEAAKLEDSAPPSSEISSGMKGKLYKIHKDSLLCANDVHV